MPKSPEPTVNGGPSSVAGFLFVSQGFPCEQVSLASARGLFNFSRKKGMNSKSSPLSKLGQVKITKTQSQP